MSEGVRLGEFHPKNSAPGPETAAPPSRLTWSSLRYLATETLKEWRDDNASRLAAALSYYTIFSLPPLLVISLTIAGRFYDRQAAQDQLLAQAGQLIGETGSQAIGQILDNASDPTFSEWAAIISVVVLFLGASAVFSELHASLNEIWEIEPKPTQALMGTIKDRLLSFGLVLGIGFLLLMSLIVSTILAGVSEYVFDTIPAALSAARVINFVISFGICIVLFALIFKIIPDVEIKWRDVWLGAAATALLFSVGKWAISVYLAQSAPDSDYGAAGALIVVVLWVYYSAQILFFGAEFTQVYANRFGGRIRPDEDAMLVAD